MSALVYAIGDIHGRLDLLNHAFSLIEADAGERPAKIVCLGDYIDRGPDSRGVIEALMAGPRREGDELVCLTGNHEALMLGAHAGHAPTERCWLGNGGLAALASYGGKVPVDHLQWVASLPVYHETEHHFFVHAGVRPGVPLENQDPDEMIWIRDRFLESEEDHGKHIVHGHTPDEEPELLPNRTNLDTGAFHTGRLTIGVFDPARPGGPFKLLVATEDGSRHPLASDGDAQPQAEQPNQNPHSKPQEKEA